MEIKESIKEKVEACLRKNEGASSVIWGEDSCTTFDENNQVIEDYMIDIEDDEIFYATLESYYMSESGEEKASKSEVAVFATNMTDAKTKLDAYMKQGLDDMAIVKIAKTKFLDLIEI